jgi:hypothetical protein
MSLPLRVLNFCGECQECCTILPINSDGWIKPAGERCEHLCAKGCSLWQQEAMPKLCRTYFCEWRTIPWLGQQADCRPDRLGVVFQDHGNLLAVFETRPGAAYGEKVCAVVRKFRLKYKGSEKLRVRVYVYQGILWLDRKHTERMEFEDEKASWVFHREPYEHFILEGVPDGPHMVARNSLEFFIANPHRQEYRIETKDGDLFPTVRVIPRSLIPQLQEIAAGKAPEGELAWLAQMFVKSARTAPTQQQDYAVGRGL